MNNKLEMVERARAGEDAEAVIAGHTEHGQGHERRFWGLG